MRVLTATDSPGPFQRVYLHRNLLSLWVLEEVRSKYSRTKLGLGWLVVQPILTTLVFTVAFTIIARVGPRGAPYPLFFLAGYVAWNAFNLVVSRSATAIPARLGVITHYRFPRELIVLTGLFSSAPELVVGLGMVAGLMLVYGISLTLSVLWLVPVLLILFSLTLGLSFWVATLNARWPDVESILPSLLRAGFYLSPVIYPVDLVPPSLLYFYLCNPIAAIVVAIRDALFVGELQFMWSLSLASAVSFLTLFTGYGFFRANEARFSDLV